jgi:hypothetical protein
MLRKGLVLFTLLVCFSSLAQAGGVWLRSGEPRVVNTSTIGYNHNFGEYVPGQHNDQWQYVHWSFSEHEPYISPENPPQEMNMETEVDVWFTVEDGAPADAWYDLILTRSIEQDMIWVPDGNEAAMTQSNGHWTQYLYHTVSPAGPPGSYPTVATMVSNFVQGAAQGEGPETKYVWPSCIPPWQWYLWTRGQNYDQYNIAFAWGPNQGGSTWRTVKSISYIRIQAQGNGRSHWTCHVGSEVHPVKAASDKQWRVKF